MSGRVVPIAWDVVPGGDDEKKQVMSALELFKPKTDHSASAAAAAAPPAAAAAATPASPTDANHGSPQAGSPSSPSSDDGSSHHGGSRQRRCCSGWAACMIIWEFIMIALFVLFVRYDSKTVRPATADPTAAKDLVQSQYPLFVDVHVMIFVGFGYLMTFLRRNMYMSVGMTFILACLCIQWYILCAGFWESVFDRHGTGHWEYINLSITSLIKADFCAGAVLITFGVVIGKTSPAQMCMVAIIETIFFALLEVICLEWGIADIGGSMLIHEYGAFFGIALALIIGAHKAKASSDNTAVYHSDLFAMIGTLFLWMYWPSFNGALGSADQQARAIINTLFSMTGSALAGFIGSHMFRGRLRFEMVDIQNATLAGGVAMGSAADMALTPGASIAIGFIAGIVSVFGFVYISPFLESKIGLHDTCGVVNLHGIPSLLGGSASVIAARLATLNTYKASLGVTFPKRADGMGGPRTALDQALMQLAFMGLVLGVALVLGFLTGVLVAKNSLFTLVEEHYLFRDDKFFFTPSEEIDFFNEGASARPARRSDPAPGFKGMEHRLMLLESAFAASAGRIAANDPAKVEGVVDKIIQRMDDTGRDQHQRMEQMFDRLLTRVVSLEPSQAAAAAAASQRTKAE